MMCPLILVERKSSPGAWFVLSKILLDLLWIDHTIIKISLGPWPQPPLVYILL